MSKRTQKVSEQPVKAGERSQPTKVIHGPPGRAAPTAGVIHGPSGPPEQPQEPQSFHDRLRAALHLSDDVTDNVAEAEVLKRLRQLDTAASNATVNQLRNQDELWRRKPGR